jgi:hypothetical protein
MRALWGFAGAVVLGGVLGACTQLAGLGEYESTGNAADGGADRDARSVDARAEVPTDGDSAASSDPGDEAGIDVCGATCPDSAGGPYACAAGGCNAEDGAACAAPSFAYSPSNFAPGSYTPPAAATTINCNTTYSSSTHAFTGWCAGQTSPAIYANVAQAGGPSVDVLAFRALTLDAGDTLTLTGGNPVILAVYGAAAIGGVIDASAQGSTAGAGATACAVGAGGGGAPGPSFTSGTDPGAAGGGGAGLAVAGGAGDYSTYNGVGGNPATGTDNSGAGGGSAHGASTVVPLIGGCSGGKGADGTASNSAGTGGVGGGGVQLSVGGTLSGSGTIKTNGAGGGTGASGAAAHTNGAGGGGGGSGGDILVESSSSTSLTLQASGGAGGPGGTGYGADTTSINTWPGTPGGPAGTSGTSGPSAAPANGGPPGERGQSYAGGGGGGGGAYGHTKINTGAAPVYACTTTISPAPACNAAHSACLCVADSDCSSGKCVNASGQCTGTCTGSGAADVASCQATVSAVTAP